MSNTPKEDIYDEQISPLMSQIIEICKENDIAIAATFELDQNPDDPDDYLHCSTVITDNHHGDRVRKVGDAIKPDTPSYYAFTVMGKTDG